MGTRPRVPGQKIWHFAIYLVFAKLQMSKPINFFHAGEINANCYGIKYFYWENKIFYGIKLIEIFADGWRLEDIFYVVGVIFPSNVLSSALVSA